MTVLYQTTTDLRREAAIIQAAYAGSDIITRISGEGTTTRTDWYIEHRMNGGIYRHVVEVKDRYNYDTKFFRIRGFVISTDKVTALIDTAARLDARGIIIFRTKDQDIFRLLAADCIAKGIKQRFRRRRGSEHRTDHEEWVWNVGLTDCFLLTQADR
jgi:hypothetical protein